MTFYQIFDDDWDCRIVAGVLQGIELTPTLLPNQKEAIAEARKAISRIQGRIEKRLETLEGKEKEP